MLEAGHWARWIPSVSQHSHSHVWWAAIKRIIQWIPRCKRLQEWCISWLHWDRLQQLTLYWVSSCTAQRREYSVSLHVALQCSLCLRQVSPGSHLRIFPRLQQCCAWSSAKETVNLRVPGSPLIWCRSGKYTTPCTKFPGAQQGRCVMQQCCQSYRPALLTHKMKTIWNLSPAVTMQNSSWLIKAPKDTQGTK